VCDEENRTGKGTVIFVSNSSFIKHTSLLEVNGLINIDWTSAIPTVLPGFPLGLP
jgi:hypothetical protein